jgi:hypothetical protein
LAPIMRLLEHKASGEFNLTKDLFNSIPTYPILSHTLGDKRQEFTLKEMADGLPGGSTLQELVAPQLVEIFSFEGELLGNKRSLEQRIHKVTGIATSAPLGQAPSKFCVLGRFSWAAKRETKRGEDKAYSLLGIFGYFFTAHIRQRARECISTASRQG